MQVGPQHIVDEPLRLEHTLPHQDRDVRRDGPREKQYRSVGGFPSDVAVLQHHRQKQTKADVGGNVDHRPHQREEGDTQEPGGGEDLDEIGQPHEGLFPEVGCIGIGKREPYAVKHRIEGEHGQGEHGRCDVEMSRFCVKTSSTHIHRPSITQQDHERKENRAKSKQNGRSISCTR